MKKRETPRSPSWSWRRWVMLGCPVMLGLALGAQLFDRVIVAGQSMVPTLQPGDRLLVQRVGHRRHLRPGDLVTVLDPRSCEHRVLVKRIGDLSGNQVTLWGDNPGASTDSRVFGRVPLGSITGRVLYRYGPPERSGSPA